MKKHNQKMVADGELVSDELIRVAVLWHEQWHERLEEASKFFFGENVSDAACIVSLCRSS